MEGGLTADSANRKRSFAESGGVMTNGVEGAAPTGVGGGGGPSVVAQAKASRLVAELVETLAWPLVQPRRALALTEPEGTGRAFRI